MRAFKGPGRFPTAGSACLLILLVVLSLPVVSARSGWLPVTPWRLAESKIVREHTWSCQRAAGLSLSPYPTVRWQDGVVKRRYRTLGYWRTRLNVCRAVRRGDVNPNVTLGRRLAAAYGWSDGFQWHALYKLWNYESGWDHHAHNASGACGIPQSMTSCFGYVPALQIRWGLRYIRGRYGAPSLALGHFYAVNWY